MFDVLIIGGGASGLMAASALALRGRRVVESDKTNQGGARASAPRIVVLEKQARVGRKLLSTGNGRCNLSNLNAGSGDYHGSRSAAQAALRAWPPAKVLAFFERLGVPCVADEAGRAYPMSRQAASVLDALRLCLDENGVETRTGFRVVKLSKIGGGFEATSDDGRVVRARCALVATGGLAAPKLGASGEGYRLLEGFGHAIAPRFCAIAALKTPPEAVRGLKGIRAEGEIALAVDGETVRAEAGELLFADSGVSGIAAMQLARQANEALRSGRNCAVRLNFMPSRNAEKQLEERAAALPKRAMEDFLNGIVPKRLGQCLAKSAGLALSLLAGELTPAQRAKLAAALTGWTLPVTGTQDFDQAQVTAGGARLKDFDLRDMQSLRAPGLFAAGEVLDVDGDCGGFNLQWAWSSALMAADGISRVLEEGR